MEIKHENKRCFDIIICQCNVLLLAFEERRQRGRKEYSDRN